MIIYITKSKRFFLFFLGTVLYFFVFMLFPLDKVSNELFYLGVGIFILLAPVHELLHALGAIMMGADKKNIYLGAKIEKGYLFCRIFQDLKRNQFIFVLLFPLLLPLISLALFYITKQVLFSIIAYLFFIGSLFDLLYMLDFLYLPSHVVVDENESGLDFSMQLKGLSEEEQNDVNFLIFTKGEKSCKTRYCFE